MQSLEPGPDPQTALKVGAARDLGAGCLGCLFGPLVVVGLIMFGVAARSPNSTSAARTPAPQENVEDLVARIDHGPGASREVVAQSGNLLTTLDSRCGQDRMMVSDIAVKGSQLVKQDYGRTVTVFEFLRELEKATRSLLGPATDCASVAAPLVVLLGRP